jgi:transcriptional regulator with XRE-family HTH domain
MATYLDRLLKVNGLSQSEVARAIGMYQPRISLLCSGHEKPSLKEATNCQNSLAFPLSYFWKIVWMKMKDNIFLDPKFHRKLQRIIDLKKCRMKVLLLIIKSRLLYTALLVR